MCSVASSASHRAAAPVGTGFHHRDLRTDALRASGANVAVTPVRWAREPTRPSDWTTEGCERMATTFDKLLLEPRRSDQVRIKPTRTAENQSAQSPSLMLLVLLACAGVIIYAVFLLNPANRGDWLPYTLVIVAESDPGRPRAAVDVDDPVRRARARASFAFHHAQDRLFDLGEIIARTAPRRTRTLWPMSCWTGRVTVDVFITVYGEDLDEIRRTATAAVAMHGRAPHLDPRRRPVRRGPRPGRRARLPLRPAAVAATAPRPATSTTRCRSPRVTTSCIFDADFVPQPEFLRRDRAVLRRPTTSPSCRRRRRTATWTTSSPAAPATCSRSSTSSSSRAGTASTPRSASARTSSSAARRSTTSAASTPTPSPRTCGPR